MIITSGGIHMQNIGENIKKARQKAHLTQKALAEKSGVATITIQQYESGKRTPNLKQLLKITDALGILLETITGGSSDMIAVPVDAGMLGTLEWYAKKQHNTVVQQLDIAIDYYLNDLAMMGELSEENDDNIPTEALDADYEKDIYFINALYNLKDEGKQVAIERVQELTEIPRYQKDKTP